MHRDLFLIAPFLSSMIQGDPLYSPSSCCFGSAWPGVGCPGGTAEAEARAFAQPLPSSAPRAFHFCFPHSTPCVLFTWLLPSNLVAMQKSMEVEDNGFSCKIQGKKWGTDFVLFQKHLQCTELHNTVYCSEAAS